MHPPVEEPQPQVRIVIEMIGLHRQSGVTFEGSAPAVAA
jgi:hypothetical protein